MKISDIEQKIRKYQSQGKKLFTTCSFQSHSLVMLHILKGIDKSIPVYFLNTGYHFPETIEFKDTIARQFQMNVTDLRSHTTKFQQKGLDGKLLFASDHDHCCYLNKVQPVENIMRSYDIWINGVRADQSNTRKAMQVEQPAQYNVIRFHPMLDWTAKMIFEYQKEHQLPRHPLESRGYLSVGCEPCTRKFDPELQAREARWFGLNKVECGLHTELINN